MKSLLYLSDLQLILSFSQSMTLKEAETLALQTLKQVMEEKVTDVNVEIAAVEKTTGRFRIYKPAEVEEIMQRLK